MRRGAYQSEGQVCIGETGEYSASHHVELRGLKRFGNVVY
jgi:hypothetical protein